MKELMIFEPEEEAPVDQVMKGSTQDCCFLSFGHLRLDFSWYYY